jgi:hypothetical protein
MIGAFARMLGARERLLAIEPTEDQQGYATRAHEPGGGIAPRKEASDAPPEGFVHKVADEGGDVYVVPMLEALRDWVRRRRGLPGADADPTPLHRKTTLPELSENH